MLIIRGPVKDPGDGNGMPSRGAKSMTHNSPELLVNIPARWSDAASYTAVDGDGADALPGFVHDRARRSRNPEMV